MKRLKYLLAIPFLAIGLQAQTLVNYVATTGLVALSGAATAATLQAPSSGGLSTIFPFLPSVGAAVYCSVNCVASVIVNATAPTTTVGTVSPSTPGDPTAFVKFFTASNFSGGTTLVSYDIPAGSTLTLDMSAIRLGAGNSNVTISIASITGNVRITFFPREAH